MGDLEAIPQSEATSISSEGVDALHVEIHVLIGEDCLTIYRVPPGEYLIGRDASCHISIEANNVSRMHARLAFHGHRILIEDLESANGTRIGGIPISLPTPIQNGTEVHIGSARLLFQFSEETLTKISAALADPNLGLEPIRNELTQDPYSVTGTIAEGGMGLVVKARDQRIRRLVAMKVLRAGFEYAADKLLRFVGEAQLTGQLEHPNIVPVYHLGVSEQGQTFYTMKYVRGQTLEEVLLSLQNRNAEARKRYTFSTLISIFQKVGDAIAFAHSRGVVHRDLKPANIMIGAFGEVLVMDWGLAKRVNEGSLAASALSADSSHPIPAQPLDSPRGFYTLDGAVVGTPPYISPEQASGNGTPNVLSDIHVLGSILYAILTLRAPILSHDVDEVIKAVSQNKFIPVREMVCTPGPHGTPPPSLVHCPGGRPPEGLVAVVEKAMHFDPTQRYQSVEELQEDITAWQNGFATKAEHAGFIRQLFLLLSRRRKEAIGAFVFAAILFGASAYFLRQLSEDRATLQSANQRFESLILQLRASADSNYQDAKAFLSRGLPKNALEQINLALVGAEESSVQKAAFLTLRGHCNMALGSYSEALQDYQKAYQILPNALPLDIIETDLNLENIEEARPPSGWSWEQIQLSPEKAASFKKMLPRKHPK